MSCLASVSPRAAMVLPHERQLVWCEWWFICLLLNAYSHGCGLPPAGGLASIWLMSVLGTSHMCTHTYCHLFCRHTLSRLPVPSVTIVTVFHRYT